MRVCSDDGGSGSEFQACRPCTDCDDCGPRAHCEFSRRRPPPPPPSPSPPPPGPPGSGECRNTCRFASDGTPVGLPRTAPVHVQHRAMHPRACVDHGPQVAMDLQHGASNFVTPVARRRPTPLPALLRNPLPLPFSPPHLLPSPLSCSWYQNDAGDCDDGGFGSEYQLCTSCDDCADCGPRLAGSCVGGRRPPPSPSPPPPGGNIGNRSPWMPPPLPPPPGPPGSGTCMNTCRFASDNDCASRRSTNHALCPMDWLAEFGRVAQGGRGGGWVDEACPLAMSVPW